MIKYLKYRFYVGESMSLEFFVGLVLVVVWASLPVALIMANTTFDNEAMSNGEHH